MTHMNEVSLLRRRARGFLDASLERLKKKDYDVAVFLAEQGAQLFLKSKILEVLGEIPRTHSIRASLAVLRNVYGSRIDEFVKERRKLLEDLDDAYLLSRYFFKTYTAEEACDLVKLAWEVVEFVEKL